jgi:class 3 adenylate cyclase
MNQYYRLVTEAADRRRGEVGTLAGTEVMVVFGRILPVDDPPLAALEAALEIARTLAPQPMEAAGGGVYFPGACVAVSCGASISGPIGGDLRKTYSTIGEVPTIAQRLARLGRPGEVLVTKELLARAGTQFVAEEVSGRDCGWPVYRVTGRRERAAGAGP